jgi:hypothetical protein
MPTNDFPIAPAASLTSFLASLDLGGPTVVDDLTVFPMMSRLTTIAWYDTLSEGVAAGRARVTKIGDAGTVPELRVVNDGERPLLIVDGEELVGAKQNRVVNLTILVPAKTTLAIPVSCVEAGRWRSVGSEFVPADRAYHASGRHDKMEQVTASLRSSATRRSDQGAIWQEIAAKSARLGARSDTSAAAAMFEQRRASLDRFVGTLQPVERQVGAVFAIRGHIAGLDAFDQPATWRRLMPKLLRSYGLDSLDSAVGGDGFSIPEPARFLKSASATTVDVFPAVGLGQDLRFDGADIVGGALSTDRGIVHVAMFPARGPVRPRTSRSRRDQPSR